MFKNICTKAETIATDNYCNVMSQMQRLEDHPFSRGYRQEARSGESVTRPDQVSKTC